MSGTRSQALACNAGESVSHYSHFICYDERDTEFAIFFGHPVNDILEICEDIDMKYKLEVKHRLQQRTLKFPGEPKTTFFRVFIKVQDGKLQSVVSTLPLCQNPPRCRPHLHQHCLQTTHLGLQAGVQHF